MMIIPTSSIITSSEPLPNNPIDSSSNRRRRVKRKMSTVSLDSTSTDESNIAEKRGVRFSEHVSVCSAPSPLDQLQLEPEREQDLWYSLHELAFFRDEARYLCREMRRLAQEDPTYNPNLLCLSRHEETRGLEMRSCLERQRRKFWTSRFLVRAAGHANKSTCNPQQLAVLSQKVTAWATELAIAQAQQDYVRAYGTPPPPRSNSSKKRSCSSLKAPERRVRARLLVAAS